LPGSFPIDYSDGVVKAIKKMQFLAIGAERNQQKKSVVREEQQHSKFATFSSSQSERKKNGSCL
jgi:predicted fused transcriptional regulator/phosphomethylpyrimidine kinase